MADLSNIRNLEVEITLLTPFTYDRGVKVVINSNQSIPSFRQKDWLKDGHVVCDLSQANSSLAFYHKC